MREISDWSKESACRNEPDTTFFTGIGENPTKARLLCPTCPVSDDCLNYAILYGERGVWGGMTEKERATLSYVKPILEAEAKRLGYLENRPSVDDLIRSNCQTKLKAERKLAQNKLQSKPLPVQRAEEFDPIVHAPSYPGAM